jgi:hypothetical protein
VDLLGHAHTGGKALLYLVDGLYSGVHPVDSSPRRWSFSPFNDDWTSSLFVSQDPLALDSVCFDLLQEEGDPRYYPQMAGADDYLHEAALADDPPSGAFYDPDHPGDVQRLSSLGVHEHWNNSTDRQYTRNLGTGTGIELIETGSAWTGIDPPVATAPRRLAVTNRPNPFRAGTEILFTAPHGGRLQAAVYNAAGRLVRPLVTGGTVEGGEQFLHWDGRDDSGRPVAAGAYFVRVEVEGLAGSRKLNLVRP